MAARSGMPDLITRWRRMVGNVGTATVDDDWAQDILDENRIDFYQDPLVVESREVNGTTSYDVYYSHYENLEGTASGTVAFRLYDSVGDQITAGFQFDQFQGKFLFDVDQSGSARYLDGRSYDLNGAAAEGWRVLSGLYSSYYDFSQEGRSFSRSQWFEHTQQMAEYYARRRRHGSTRRSSGVVERGDMV